jgi:tetrahydromethanopterin S-methyltransferase subunit G
MKDKAFEKATEYIDAIAAKLDVAAEHVYGLMVRQQVTEGITHAIVVSVILLALLILLLKLIKGLKNYDGLDEEYFIYPIVIISILLVVVTIIGGFVMPLSVMKIINPEYYAIKEILDVIGGGN